MNRLFVDSLTVIDFAYLDTRRGLLGESWIVDLELGGALDEQGMLFDFGHVKRVIKQLIDEEIDHRLVIPDKAPGLSIHSGRDPISLTWRCTDSSLIRLHSPRQAVMFLDAPKVDMQDVATWLERELKAILPDNVTSVHIHLREEAISGPQYHYVHGLKKHLGNCQRIAHGHRSKLDIWRDGEKDDALEAQWAERWRDIYIGTREDITDRSIIDDRPYLHFAYESEQGEFELTLPESRVYLIDTDSTVEWIANHLAEACKAQYPGSTIRVKAYEGVGKGAVAER